MNIALHIVFLVVGFAMLIKGADIFVVSSSSIAQKFRISPLVIGLTLVAFGTSLPELAVSLAASISAQAAGTTADIAMGNIIGSNIANLTLILGFSAVLIPISVKRSMRKQEFPFLIAITVLLAVFAFLFQADAQIDWWESLILLAVFTFYMYLMFKTQKEPPQDQIIEIIDSKKSVVLLVGGLVGVSLGGFLVTTGAEFISYEILVKTFSTTATKAATLVGLSVVSLGTSLPELVTSITAAKKGENEIALGNVLGSNIFNTLLIIGIAGVVTPLGINPEVLIDIKILMGITLITVLVALTHTKISRKNGYFLLIIYISYITYIVLRAFNVV